MYNFLSCKTLVLVKRRHCMDGVKVRGFYVLLNKEADRTFLHLLLGYSLRIGRLRVKPCYPLCITVSLPKPWVLTLLHLCHCIDLFTTAMNDCICSLTTDMKVHCPVSLIICAEKLCHAFVASLTPTLSPTEFYLLLLTVCIVVLNML